MYRSGRLAQGKTTHRAKNPCLGQEGWHSVAQDIMLRIMPGNNAGTAKNVSGSPHHETMNRPSRNAGTTGCREVCPAKGMIPTCCTRWCRCHPISVAAAGLPVEQQQQRQSNQLGDWPSELLPRLQTASPFAPAEQPAPPQQLLLLLMLSSTVALLTAVGARTGGDGVGGGGGGVVCVLGT